MRLFESILDANHRAVAGDTNAGLHPAEYADELPIVALTCIDPRLNAFFPNVLALPAEDFIWLRNAGNIITSPLSSTMRSLTLACAVKGAKEIAIIGHTDCQICKMPTMQLLDRLKALGVDRSKLPENITEFFGTFGSERQNVIRACDFVHNSPLTGPAIPVHGLLLDIETGKLDWVVNGYDTHQARLAPAPTVNVVQQKIGEVVESLGTFKDFAIGEMKFPEAKIGEAAARLESKVSQEAEQLRMKAGQGIQSVAESVEHVLGQVAQYAEKNWPKPPPLHGHPAPLPPLKKKSAPPPPIRPQRSDFRRG